MPRLVAELPTSPQLFIDVAKIRKNPIPFVKESDFNFNLIVARCSFWRAPY